jgi:hypothetical protein
MIAHSGMGHTLSIPEWGRMVRQYRSVYSSHSEQNGRDGVAKDDLKCQMSQPNLYVSLIRLEEQ